MAKSLLKIEARKLRKKGESVRSISKKLIISKSSVSIWVRDIILSIEQLENLRKSQIKGGERGRIIGSLMQKHRRMDLIEKYKKEGVNELQKVSEKELKMIFLALYWAE